MFMTDINDVKIYNLSAGKSIPDWLTDQRKRSKLKKQIDSRRQIELIQDFDMPCVSTSIRMSPDNQYILATGTYKPRVKCYEVANLSIKFERCFDSEVTTFEVLSDDYSKLVFLQCDRYVEFHAAHGRHYRLRIPRFGRDLKYHLPSCDLFIVGTSSDIYRLNLERGQFLQPFVTEASCSNACAINPEHHLLVVGTKEGTIEAWDPRERKRCGTLDVAIKLPNSKNFPSVNALKFKNGLQMSVGTASGQVLLYDIRSKEPMFIKDHLNQLPIKRIEHNPNMNVVYSMDSAMLKIWDENSGKQIAYIESQSHFNDFCTIENTGMFFFAQEDVKMLTYYIPSLGLAPKWCSFLDNITEEIESEVAENIYDDYKFVTKKELDELGLDHLIGTNLLRAYMHGYFMDIRLYNKAKSAVQPFSYENYRKDKIRKEIESQYTNRIQIKSDLPKINQELALKIIHENENNKMKKQKMPNLLEDTRFKQIFENPDFKIDKNAEEYRILAPALNRLEKSKLKEIKKRIEVSHVEKIQAEENQKHESSDDEDLFKNDQDESDKNNEESDSSEDDANEYSKEMKKVFKEINRDKRRNEIENDDNDDDDDDDGQETEKSNRKTKMFELDDMTEFRVNKLKTKTNKKSLLERLNKELATEIKTIGGNLGNRQMKFEAKPKTKEMKKREYEMRKHRQERKEILRSTASLKLKKIRVK